MKLAASVVLLALFAVSPEVRYFRYQRPIQVAAQQSGQTCLAVDPAIFAHAAPQLADLRLYSNGVETPYILRIAPTIQDVQVIRPLNLGVNGEQTVFDAELPGRHYSDVELAITGQNFIATVTVSGSAAQSGGRITKLGAFTIFDLTRQRLGRSTVLHLPESDFPYLHFRIAGPIKPEQITGLSVLRLAESEPKYQTVASTAQVTQKDHTSIIEFTVPAHVPVDLVEVTPGPAPALFSRDVTASVVPVVQPNATDQDQLPQAVTSSGNLLRIHKLQDGKRIDEERLDFAAPQHAFDPPTKWTIAIDNGDDAPIALESVRLLMLERTLCFDAAAGAAYTLYYGDPALTAPRYDYATLFTPQAKPAGATTGPETPNPDWQARPDDRPFTEKHPALLWIALIAVIALLGAIALKSRKGVSLTP